jgi:sulfite reductase (ferredoxin)
VTAIGVGECAGVVIDLVATLLLESREKLANAEESKQQQKWSDSIYHTYASMINGAKAILLTEGLSANSYANIIEQFDEAFISAGKISLDNSFADLVYQIKENEPTAEFAEAYYAQAARFYYILNEYREKEVLA